MINVDRYKSIIALPEKMRAVLAQCPVKGIDIEQVHNMILHCPETSSYLYGEYTPTKPSYRKGTRPVLEKIAQEATRYCRNDRERIQALLAWVETNVTHAHGHPGDAPPDRAATEETLIESGWGWCNEQTRVFICLAQVLGFMSRLCFLGDEMWGHVTAEAYLEDRWAFADATYGVLIAGSDGRLASARDIQKEKDEDNKRGFSEQYRRAQIRELVHWKHRNPDFDITTEIGNIYGVGLFAYFSLCNYII